MHRKDRREFRPSLFPCEVPSCKKVCKSAGGLRRHVEQLHTVPAALQHVSNRDPGPAVTPSQVSPPSSPGPGSNFCTPSPAFLSQRSPRRLPSGSPLRLPQPQQPQLAGASSQGLKVQTHPLLDGMVLDCLEKHSKLTTYLATPCDPENGFDWPAGAPPPEPKGDLLQDYSPFNTRAEFELAEFLFVQDEMSAKKIDRLMHILAALYPDNPPPVADHKEMYSLIDAVKQGDVPWDSFSVTFDGDLPDGEVPPWMTQKYEVWFCDPLRIMENQIGNPDFNGGIDLVPKRVFYKGK